MPLYIDIHELKGVRAADVAKAHAADVEKQGAHDVNYLKYWVNESCGKVFCLVDAPSSEAAVCVHREAHGLEPGRIIEVQPEVVDAFIGGGEVNEVGAALVPGRGDLDTAQRTILFTDMVGSTSMTQQLGDRAALRLLELHDAVVRECLAQLHGREVKHTGDGIMACFLFAPDAVQCGLQIQRQLAARSSELDHAVRLRIGAAAGEPVEQRGDFFGLTVNLAARLCAHAQPEQMLVTADVVELCSGADLNFEGVGELALKGFDRPVPAYAAVAV